ncbi:iron chelate uptake ABC transporter family permease subunit [Gordonia sp. HY002]|uniref:FecCD family ABC transporter permease n=1 Tax=Gordonia zhenghanii TaxID=2911516 RepID=UPI001F01FEE4|nr:iron chelate uptake ABC transporter family permease subunit [Gordonia zhenghanii]MCF8569171.1 iron chelate uptake ABC transporter family permease subunit [Gordonia zhenghanii]
MIDLSKHEPIPDDVAPAPRPRLPIGMRFGGVVSFVWRPRPVIVTVIAAVGAFVFFCMSIRMGDLPLSFTQVVETLIGRGDALSTFIVNDLRLPRALMAVIVGAGLAMSGAIVQSISHNPLASPDILGISAGAGVTAVFLLTAGGAATGVVRYGMPGIALAGALITGVLVYVLAARGGMNGMRLILIGVAVNALMHALITWMMVRADIDQVGQAQTWLVGSLDARTWDQVIGTGVLTAIAAVVAIVAAFALRAVQLGDDVAQGLGVGLGRTRAVLLIAAVVLAAAAVSGAGPIAFVAFVSPQVTMRLTGLSSPPLIPSAAVGAFLLAGADLVARTLLPVTLPVGIVTAAVGGPFLVYLLIRQNVRSSR